MKNNGKKVYVGLSGGVDSAVSAALLKKEGYEVTGVFIKAWSPEGYPCTWKEDRRSAMRAAAVLDIPFLTLDLEKEYKKEVVDYMISEYKAGRTPNPDVMCNKEIKFGYFLKFALDNGADFVATGHYAQVVGSRAEMPGKILEKSLVEPRSRRPEDFSERIFSWHLLKEGADKNKDQSYFLWTLTQDQLKHVLFPIGHLQKSEVRKLADKFKLPQAVRKDSQGVCFLGQIDMKEFLKEFVGAEKGNVLNEKGEVVGEHDGAILYTIGERHGFHVENKNTENEPLYVVAKDINKNTVTVAPKTASQKVLARPTRRQDGRGSPHRRRSVLPDIFSKQFLTLKDINLPTEISNENLSCRIRYRGEKIPCQIDDNKVTLKKPRFDISAGQSLVLYQDEICLGGGIMLE